MISLTDIWLHQFNLDSNITFHDLKSLFRHDRQADVHSGVAVYAKETFYSRQSDDLELCDVECVWIKVSNKEINLYL